MFRAAAQSVHNGAGAEVGPGDRLRQGDSAGFRRRQSGRGSKNSRGWNYWVETYRLLIQADLDSRTQLQIGSRRSRKKIRIT